MQLKFYISRVDNYLCCKDRNIINADGDRVDQD